MTQITNGAAGNAVLDSSPVARQVYDAAQKARVKFEQDGKILSPAERDMADRLVIAAANKAATIRQIVRGACEQDSLFRFAVSGMTDAQIDAAGVSLGEELIKVSAENVRFLETNLKAAELFDAVSDPPAMGHSEYAWQYLTGSGNAQISDTLRAGVAFDSAQVTREGRNTELLRFVRMGYDYDDLELARAALSMISLDAEKQRIALRKVAEKLDSIYLVGDATWGLSGALNQTAIVGANTNNTGGALSGLSAANLLAFWKARFDAYLNAVNLNGISWRWKVLTSFAEHKRVLTTELGTGYQTTVFAQLEKVYGQFGFDGFENVIECATAGTGTSQMAMIYPVRGSRGMVSPERVAVPGFMVAPPFRRGWTTEHEVAAKTGGTILKAPTAIHYVYNL